MASSLDVAAATFVPQFSGMSTVPHVSELPHNASAAPHRVATRGGNPDPDLLRNLSAAFPQHDTARLFRLLDDASWDASRAVEVLSQLDDEAMARRLQRGTDAPKEASSRDRRQQAMDEALASRLRASRREAESEVFARQLELEAGDAALARRLELEGRSNGGREPARNGSAIARQHVAGNAGAGGKPRRLQGRQYGPATAMVARKASSGSGPGPDCQPGGSPDLFPVASFSEIIDEELATQISLLDNVSTDHRPGQQVRFLGGGDNTAPPDQATLALRRLATGPSSGFLELQEWYAFELTMQRFDEDGDGGTMGRRQQRQARRRRAAKDETVLGSNIVEIDCHGLCLESALEYTKRFLGLHQGEWSCVLFFT